MTYRALANDGQVVWLSSVSHLTIDQESRQRVRGLETDVTAMKRAEAQARESEERFRLLSEASRDAVIVHTGGAIVEVNQAFCDHFAGRGRGAGAGGRGLHRAGVAPHRPGPAGGRATAPTSSRPASQRRSPRVRGPEPGDALPREFARVVVLTDITDLKARAARVVHDANS